MKRRSVRLIGYQTGGAFLNGLTHIRFVIASRREVRLWRQTESALSFIWKMENLETPSHLGRRPAGPKTIAARAKYKRISADWYAATLELRTLVESFGFTWITYKQHAGKCRALGLPITNLPCA